MKSRSSSSVIVKVATVASVVVLAFEVVHAFVPSSSSSLRQHGFSTRVLLAQKDASSSSSSSSSEHQHDDDPHLNRIEQARKEFEHLIQDESISAQVYQQQQQQQQQQNNNDQEPTLLEGNVLTTVSRHRRQVEMALLDTLRDSNNGLEELLLLWITECGDEAAAQRILDMQEHCSTGLVQELADLQQMMQEHPTWAEPAIRLATVYFYKGRTDDAYQLALHALQLKPWHIEIPQLLIMCSLRNQDLKQAVYWARHSLPRMTPSILEGDKERFLRRREEWVENAMLEAQQQLEQAEERSAAARAMSSSISSSSSQMASSGEWQ